MSEKDKILKLRKEIKRYNYYYYIKNEPLISDTEFDKLLKELEVLEKKYPELKDENSPTNKVGSSIENNKFKKVEHKKPMLSLSNTYNTQDILDFHNRIVKFIESNNIEYTIEMKLDGLSITLIYENGELIQALTRGDGIIGEDVTENILQIKSIPKYLKENISVEVRGEVVLPISEFKKLNEIRINNGEEPFANPRNAASGTLRQLDKEIVKSRNLDAYFYFLVDSDKYNINSHFESLKVIEKLGLKTTKIYKKFKINEVEKYIKKFDEIRKNLDYETDGLVIKVDNINLYNILGNTTKSPRWAIAYKFPAKQATTKINNVTLQVGRTGVITPVAELEEIELSGSLIKRASLHNFEEIKRKDIKIGDTVFIEKAAEIIPQVVKVIKELRTGNEKNIEIPKTCPACGSKLIKENGLVALKCTNNNCSAKLQRKIEYFVSRDAMNIDGLGGKIIEKFIEIGKLKNIDDIYTLHNYKTELISLEKMGEKSVENLLTSIENSKNQKYEKVIYALGIPFVGKFTANILAKHSKNIDSLIRMSKEELLEIENIGEKIADSIVHFFKNPENIKLIDRLKKYGINFTISSKNNSNNIFEGKTFLATGSLKKYKRSEIRDIIENNGGKYLSTVSKNLNYLIAGEKAGSKLKKAKEMNITILSEKEFENLLNSNTNINKENDSIQKNTGQKTLF
ncbi:DNA ligase (NAD+) [Hypnocyclicus thermotrophus]|uniref:DNA ligase n=1 Tax=Hypnocyclicus thermotrophus TaxID=1627895 RepID=A0AA46DY21_9FUSO|nr:NAD-dependent DNA ligase LigA [Hypnocyclicus thermotrophus]TDT69714.1 DNA ligase (NAD+) [Hypnocyclicus thermotrophus]